VAAARDKLGNRRVGEAGKTYSCSRHCLGNDRGPDLRSRDITHCFLVALDDRDYFFVGQRRARESIMMTMHDMINADRVTEQEGTSGSSTLPEIVTS